MGTYATVPETLKKFYDAEYLYNMLPLDVVGDTLGVLYGRRRNLKNLRQLYREPDAVWRRMFPNGVESSLASGVHDLLYQRVAVSRTRTGEPITLAPVSLECVGDGQGDKSVANAYRAIGGLASRFFTESARQKLLEHVELWSRQPLARLTEAVLRHADTSAGGKAAKPVEPPLVSVPELPAKAARLTIAREDLEHLVHAWDDAPFGPQQQLDQLRTLICFHVTLYIFQTAAQPLLHREERASTRLALVCDAAQVVGSPLARVAYQSLAFWMGRLREANLEICYRSAASLRAADTGAWDRIFAEIQAASPEQREAMASRRAESVANWVFPEDRRRSRHNAELSDLLTAEIRQLYARTAQPQSGEDQQRALAEAMLGLFASKSRVLHKVFDCVRSVGDGAGLIGPKGTHQKKRFLLRADLLETLSVVHCARAAAGNVVSDDPLSAGAMLRTWFERYGIIVDAARPEVVEAVEKGHLDPRLVPHLPDAALSADNVREFEDRLVELGLARRFSDASVSLDERSLLPRTHELS